MKPKTVEEYARELYLEPEKLIELATKANIVINANDVLSEEAIENLEIRSKDISLASKNAKVIKNYTGIMHDIEGSINKARDRVSDLPEVEREELLKDSRDFLTGQYMAIEEELHNFLEHQDKSTNFYGENIGTNRNIFYKPMMQFLDSRENYYKDKIVKLEEKTKEWEKRYFSDFGNKLKQARLRKLEARISKLKGKDKLGKIQARQNKIINENVKKYATRLENAREMQIQLDEARQDLKTTRGHEYLSNRILTVPLSVRLAALRVKGVVVGSREINNVRNNSSLTDTERARLNWEDGAPLQQSNSEDLRRWIESQKVKSNTLDKNIENTNQAQEAPINNLATMVELTRKTAEKLNIVRDQLQEIREKLQQIQNRNVQSLQTEDIVQRMNASQQQMAEVRKVAAEIKNTLRNHESSNDLEDPMDVMLEAQKVMNEEKENKDYNNAFVDASSNLNNEVNLNPQTNVPSNEDPLEVMAKAQGGLDEKKEEIVSEEILRERELGDISAQEQEDIYAKQMEPEQDFMSVSRNTNEEELRNLRNLKEEIDELREITKKHYDAKHFDGDFDQLPEWAQNEFIKNTQFSENQPQSVVNQSSDTGLSQSGPRR